MARASALVAVVFLVACAPIEAAPSKIPSETPSPAPTSTPSEQPTITPTVTRTRTPTKTPTATVEPQLATQTAASANRTATAVFVGRVAELKELCKDINWQELADIPYAQEYELRCVRIRGRVWATYLTRDIIDISIGSYSANLVIGTDDISSMSGRIVEEMFITVYGTVSTNDFWRGEDRTPAVGLHAHLIEGPGGVLWLDEAEN